MTDAEAKRRLELTLAQAGNTHSIADLVTMLEEQRARLFHYRDGYVVAEINRYPRLSAVNYWLIWGALKDCLALEHEVGPWAIEQGCTVATAMGRPGWLRAAGPTGWRLHGYAYGKELVHGRR